MQHKVQEQMFVRTKSFGDKSVIITIALKKMAVI